MRTYRRFWSTNFHSKTEGVLQVTGASGHIALEHGFPTKIHKSWYTERDFEYKGVRIECLDSLEKGENNE